MQIMTAENCMHDCTVQSISADGERGKKLFVNSSGGIQTAWEIWWRLGQVLVFLSTAGIASYYVTERRLAGLYLTRRVTVVTMTSSLISSTTNNTSYKHLLSTRWNIRTLSLRSCTGPLITQYRPESTALKLIWINERIQNTEYRGGGVILEVWEHRTLADTNNKLVIVK